MSTLDYIDILRSLKPGDLGLLRTHAGQGIDRSSQAFDLFASIWWPLRSKNAQTPRREVAWLIAKLYAQRQLAHSPGDTLARQLARCQPNDNTALAFRKRFDRLLAQPLRNIEEHLQWALGCIPSEHSGIDWVKLTDNLSRWEREDTRLSWAKEFMGVK